MPEMVVFRWLALVQGSVAVGIADELVAREDAREVGG